MNIVRNSGYEPWALFPTNIILSLICFSFVLEYFCIFIYRSQCLLMAQGLSPCSSFFLAASHYAPTWTSCLPSTDCGTAIAFLTPHSVPVASCRCPFCLNTYTANNCRETGWNHTCGSCRGSR